MIRRAAPALLLLVALVVLDLTAGLRAQTSTTPPPNPAVPIQAVPPPDATGRAQRPGQRGAGRQTPPNPDAPMTVAQVEQMFDNYAVIQAQTELGLDDAQLLRFTRRFQALQNVRRRAQRQRQVMLRELNTLAAAQGATAADPAAITAKIAELDNQLVQAAQQVRRAYGAIDEVLTPSQRARFRMFEFRMERKKLELIARAQAAARGGGPELR